MATLALIKSDTPNPVVVGQPLTYTISIINLGPDTATNVVLTDLLPSSAAFSSASVPCVSVENTLTCTLGDIAPASSTTVLIAVVPSTPGTIVNAASAQGANTNVAVTTAQTLVLLPTFLTLTKSDSPDPATVGQPLTYNLTVSNVGQDDAVNVSLIDVLPDAVTFVSANAPCTLGSGNVLTCTLGTIPFGSGATVLIHVVPNSPGTVTNLASAEGTSTNRPTVTASTQVNLAPGPSADLAVTKSFSPSPARVGHELTYTVTVRNNGPGPATGVTLTDTLSPNVIFVSGTPSQGSCSRFGITLTCLLGALAVGGAATVIIRVIPRVRGPITNTAHVQGNEFDPNPANNTAVVTTVVGNLSPCNPCNPCAPCSPCSPCSPIC